MLIAALLSAVLAALLTAGGLALVMRYLARRQIVDRPNERSSHSEPTPRGGGLALVPAVLLVWAAIAWEPTGWLRAAAAPGMGWLLAATLALAAVSWIDDLRGLAPLPRLLAHAAAIAVVLAAVPLPGPVFQGWLPAWLDLALAGFVWLWFVNLFNFMDGIDGISGVEALAITIGVAVVHFLAPIGDAPLLMAAALGGGAIAFLGWNWAPARVFLGDVGSVPLGYLLGWLLLWLAGAGQWAAALILPAYYLADATLTLLRRAMRGERVWQAHRQHFYQQAVRRGLGHAAVSGRIALANTGLVACAAAAALGWPWPALAAAVVIVLLLLYRLAGAPGDAEAAS